MLSEALAWWAARMAEMVPARLKRRQTAEANALVIVAPEAPGGSATGAVEVRLRRNRRESLLGTFDIHAAEPIAARRLLAGHAAERTVMLRPAPGTLLEKPLVLPIAAERELRRVVGYEISRVTPFEADEVFWNWTVTHHDRPRGRLHVRLSMIPKCGLQPLLAVLDQAGLKPAGIEATVPGGDPRLIPLHHDDDADGWRRATVIMAGGCAALAVVAAALPFIQQSIALSEVEDRIAALQPRVSEVQALRQRISAENAAGDAIAEARLKTGNALEVLAALTELLPDDTFLNDVTLRQRRLTVTGQSAAAPKLIATLAGDDLFRNPGFAAPVTRNEAAKRDVFSIQTEVGP